LLLFAACGANITGTAETAHDAGVVDTARVPDATADALTLGPWSAPAAFPAGATSVDEDDVTLSSTALEMIFAVSGATGKTLYYTSRKAIGAAWSQIEPLPFSSTMSDETPRFSGDDMTLYFSSDRNKTAGDLDVYTVSRTMTGSNAAWGKVAPVPGINTTAVEKWFAPCGNGRFVVVQARTDTGTDLLEGTLGGGTPTPIGVLNSALNETSAFLTQDCLTIYFASNRNTRAQIFVSHRTAIDQPWQRPVTIDDFKIGAGTDNQEDPWLSPDGRTFAFASDASGSKDIYLSTR
jgi:Tol biopolymer transport system component